MTVGSKSTDTSLKLKSLVLEHPSAKHSWFSYMYSEEQIKAPQLVSLLVNYDAHASLLRRLLLNAATLMPDPAVGFVIENVRNEYGNGDYSKAHQNQLHDLVKQLCTRSGLEFDLTSYQIKPGVIQYMEEIPSFYYPEAELVGEESCMYVAAGAITATELLAVKEFLALQKAFKSFEDLTEHVWFDHVNLEEEHADESLDLVRYFLNQDPQSFQSIEFGVGGVLMCNSTLYDGFLEAVKVTTKLETAKH